MYLAASGACFPTRSNKLILQGSTMRPIDFRSARRFCLLVTGGTIDASVLMSRLTPV